MIFEAIKRLVPDAKFAVIGNKKEWRIDWQDERAKPHLSEILEILPAVEKKIEWKEKKQNIISEFVTKMKALVTEYPDTEQKTWPVQTGEARKALAGAAAEELPMLTNITGSEDLDVLKSFAVKVLEKEKALAEASGALLKWKREALKQIETEGIVAEAD